MRRSDQVTLPTTPTCGFYTGAKDRVGFADLPQELGRVFCERALEEWGFTLERYALSFC